MIMSKRERKRAYLLVGIIIFAVGIISAKITADHAKIWDGVSNNMEHIITAEDDIKKLKEETTTLKIRVDDLFKD
jgi:conjugal transfer/entry exclusion protein